MEDILGFSIYLDMSWIETIGAMPFYQIMWHFFINGGWIIILLVCLWGGFEIFHKIQEDRFGAKQNYIFLAIDIPKLNLQSPKAMENFFGTLSGAHMPLEWEEKLFQGQYQLGFSFEIVSIDGFVQFVVRTPIHWRDLVEAAFYSVYPDAEITEVEDFAADLDITFPNDEYNMWGSDLVLVKDFAFPIKTYVEFEHTMTKELKDPLASLLEVMNTMRPGEQFWFQMLVYPTDPGWNRLGQKTLKKVLGEQIKLKKNFIDKLIESPVALLSEVSKQLTGTEFGLTESAGKDEEKQRFFLTPEQKEQAEGIVHKLSKMAFECKLRIIYLAKREVFNKGRGVSATFGAFKQLAQLNLNAFKPDKNKTQARWPWFKKSRLYFKQNRIFRAFRKRDAQTATPKSQCYLNIEELATLFHFPNIETYSPVVKKIESKKSKAPVELPSTGIGLPVEEAAPAGERKVTREPVVDYDDDYFENRFAKDKTRKSDKLRKQQVLEKMQDNKIKVADLPPVDLFEPPVKPALEQKATLPQPAEQEKKPKEKTQEPPLSTGKPPANLPFAD